MGNTFQAEEPPHDIIEVAGRQWSVELRVGRGNFGTVHVLEDCSKDARQLEPKKRTRLAIKVLEKRILVQQLIGGSSVLDAFRERYTLQQIYSPFVCNLYACAQDTDRLFMVFDLMRGGDLAHAKRAQEIGRFSSSVVKFIGACMLRALAHLSKHGIAHRDVKVC
jgi:serine/threonine protein kinase